MSKRTVLVTGAAGQLGHALGPLLVDAGWEVHLTDLVDLARLDITDEAAVHDAVAGLRPDVVVNLAAEVDADRCEREPEHAQRVNADGPRHLAEACADRGALFVQISSDYVFPGDATEPYAEDDPVGPLSVYGRTKVEAEQVTVDAGGLALRTAWLSGRAGSNITKTALRLAADPSRDLAFVDDQRGSPTMDVDLAGAIVRLADGEVRGLLHVTNSGEASWFEVVDHVLRQAGFGAGRVRAIPTDELVPPRDATRPSFSVLDGSRLRDTGIGPLRPWTDAYAELVDELVAASAVVSP